VVVAVEGGVVEEGARGARYGREAVVEVVRGGGREGRLAEHAQGLDGARGHDVKLVVDAQEHRRGAGREALSEGDHGGPMQRVGERVVVGDDPRVRAAVGADAHGVRGGLAARVEHREAAVGAELDHGGARGVAEGSHAAAEVTEPRRPATVKIDDAPDS